MNNYLLFIFYFIHYLLLMINTVSKMNKSITLISEMLNILILFEMLNFLIFLSSYCTLYAYYNN